MEPNHKKEEGSAAEPHAVTSPVHAALDAVRSTIARLLRVSDEGKPHIYAKVFAGAEFNDLNFWLETLFSIGIATLGLITNSPAVVIGAMLISPLMGPITANGMALALGDFYLGIKSSLTLVLSIFVSIATAAFITWVLPFHSPTPEILARVQPTLLDLGIAILSGAAGAIVVCRGGAGGGITALPGVAVAVALMPPLGVVGFGVGSGWNWEIVTGGGLLFLTNLVAIIFTSFVVFFVVRMDAPQVRQKINQWLYEHERGERLYEIVEQTPLRALLGKVGSFPRRLLIMLIFLVSVSLPLGRTLLELAENARVRRVVIEELDAALPREAVVRQDLEVTAERVRLRIVALAPEGFPREKRAALQERIAMRAGRPATVQVFDVATTDEVTEITGRLARDPASREPIVMTLDELRARLWLRVRPAVESAWPATAAPLAGYTLSFAPDSDAVRVQIAYLADEGQTFGELGAEAVRNVLRDRMGSNSLDLELERVTPGLTVRFPPRLDALATAGIRPLESLAATMQRFPRLRLRITAPAAAESGSAADALAKRRIARLTAFLTERKIDPARMETPAGDSSAENDFVLRLFPAAN